jgi:hypothetical protein
MIRRTKGPAPRNLKDPREQACRDICKAYKIPADAMIEGRPMWSRFLNQVEATMIVEEAIKF